ncbi:MAG: hypothetical protein ACAH88_19680, partial [Roseimicrobium sp.]
MHLPFRTLLIAALATAPAISAFSQSVVLWRPQEPQRGSEWREDTRLELAGMKINIGSGQQALDGAGNFQFMETVERKYTGMNKQDAQVLASTLQGTLAFLGQSADQLQGGALLGKKLVGKKERDAWHFEFKDVKPSPEEQKALDAFGSRSGLIALWSALYGSQARRKGETWKADTA